MLKTLVFLIVQFADVDMTTKQFKVTEKIAKPLCYVLPKDNQLCFYLLSLASTFCCLSSKRHEKAEALQM